MPNRMWIGTELYNGSFGKFYKQNDIDNILSFADEIGVDKIDTAECYNVENIIGNSLKNTKNKFKIATKFGHEIHGNNKISSFSLNSVKKQLENSLKSLQVDYIDLYYFHSGSNLEFQNDEVWGFLNSMQVSGLIRELGLSLKHNLVISEDYYQINLAKDYGISVVQTVLNKYSQCSLKYVIPYCQDNNIKVLGRMPLAKGLLTGKYDSNHVFNDHDIRSKSEKLNHNIIDNHKQENYHSALKWCINHVDEVVIGSKNITQLAQNHKVINVSRH